MGEDEVDEAFDVVTVGGVEEFDFGMDVVGVDIAEGEGLRMEWCVKGMMDEGEGSLVREVCGEAFL